MKDTVSKYLKALVPAEARPRVETVAKKVRHFGLTYRCPLCHSALRGFLPYGLDFPVLKEMKVVGGGWRRECLCPVCESFDRERLLYLYLRHETDVFAKPYRLLHIAPEVQVRKILALRPNLDYVTADLYKPDIDVKLDVTDIQFPDGSFDAIICNHVLEHVIEDRKAMRELHRVLKPGGWAILQVPIALGLNRTHEDLSITTPRGREQAFGQYDHVRLYAGDYAERLAEAGFKVETFDWRADAANFGGIANMYGLNKNERVYKCHHLW